MLLILTVPDSIELSVLERSFSGPFQYPIFIKVEGTWMHFGNVAFRLHLNWPFEQQLFLCTEPCDHALLSALYVLLCRAQNVRIPHGTWNVSPQRGRRVFKVFKCCPLHTILCWTAFENFQKQRNFVTTSKSGQRVVISNLSSQENIKINLTFKLRLRGKSYIFWTPLLHRKKI